MLSTLDLSFENELYMWDYHYCPAGVKSGGKAETGVMAAFICYCLMPCIGCRIEGRCESSGSSTPDHFVAPVLHIDSVKL